VVNEPGVGLRERKKLDTWHALRSAALQLITEHGYEAVTVEDIAAAAGVSKRTYFNYFDSKEAVVFDPDPDEPARWDALAKSRPRSEPIWESLEQFFLAYLATHAKKLPIQKRLIAASPTLAQLARATSDQFHAFLSAWVAERLDLAEGERFDATVITTAALAALNVAFAAWDPDSGPDALHLLIRRAFGTITTRPTPSRRRKEHST
jgi:AcrR family transcriptional regulator